MDVDRTIQLLEDLIRRKEKLCKEIQELSRNVPAIGYYLSRCSKNIQPLKRLSNQNNNLVDSMVELLTDGKARSFKIKVNGEKSRKKDVKATAGEEDKK